MAHFLDPALLWHRDIEERILEVIWPGAIQCAITESINHIIIASYEIFAGCVISLLLDSFKI